MIKLCITLATLTVSFSLAAQVEIKNGKLSTKPLATHYEILQALAKHHHLHLVLKSPRESYNTKYEVTTIAVNLDTILKVMYVGTGMKHLVRGDTLKVGWARGK